MEWVKHLVQWDIVLILIVAIHKLIGLVVGLFLIIVKWCSTLILRRELSTFWVLLLDIVCLSSLLFIKLTLVLALIHWHINKMILTWLSRMLQHHNMRLRIELLILGDKLNVYCLWNWQIAWSLW